MLEPFQLHLLLRHPVPCSRHLELICILQTHHILVAHILLGARATPALSLQRVSRVGSPRLMLAVRVLTCGGLLASGRPCLLGAVCLY